MKAIRLVAFSLFTAFFSPRPSSASASASASASSSSSSLSASSSTSLRRPFIHRGYAHHRRNGGGRGGAVRKTTNARTENTFPPPRRCCFASPLVGIVGGRRGGGAAAPSPVAVAGEMTTGSRRLSHSGLRPQRRRRRPLPAGGVFCADAGAANRRSPTALLSTVVGSGGDGGGGGSSSSSRNGVKKKPPRRAASEKTKGRREGDGSNDRRRRKMKKLDIDNLVRGIGLNPVASKNKGRIKPSVVHETVKGDRRERVGTPPSSNPDDHPRPSLLRPANVPLRVQLDYARNGHACLRSFLDPGVVDSLRSELVPLARANALNAWRQKVEVALADPGRTGSAASSNGGRGAADAVAASMRSVRECKDALKRLGVLGSTAEADGHDGSGGDLPFLQHFNLWRTSPIVSDLVRSPLLGSAASALMGDPPRGVRLYQDSLFLKRGTDGRTPWHSDARMAPFDTSNMVTFWIPLDRVPLYSEEEESEGRGSTGLRFASGSHADFALPYWNGRDGPEHGRLEPRYGGPENVRHHMPLEVGDVTVHDGWTLHCADGGGGERGSGGTTVRDRYALACTYVDASAEVREDALSFDADGAADGEDVWSFRSWAEDVEPRTQFEHPSVPIVWPLKKTRRQ